MSKLIVLLLAMVATVAHAQKNIEFVIPFAPGGTADRTALILLAPMREELAAVGMTPILTYRPGASSIVATASVANSDRLQILMTPSTVITAGIINPTAVTYNIQTDLLALEYLGHVPLVMVTHANSKIKTIKDLQRECQRRTVTFGSAGVGSVTHIASATVFQHLRCTATHVPYKGVGPALNDLQGQHIDIVTDFVTSVRSRIDSNVFRPILSVEQHKNPEFPDLPSMSDLGHKDYEFYNWFILSAGASTTGPDIELVRRALKALMQRPDVKQQLRDAGLQGIGTRMGPNFFSQQHTKLEKIVKHINVDAR